MTSSARTTTIPVWRQIGAAPTPPGPERQVDVVVVGGGPVGLTIALDLGRRGHRVVLLNRLDFIAGGSKAICFAKRTLDIWNRLGIGETVMQKGVVWNVGKVFRGDDTDPIYQFDMQPVKHQEMPGFVNLQQYHVEDLLVEALAQTASVDLRWGHEAVSIRQDEDGAELDVLTAQGGYTIKADWVVASDGSRSGIRDMLGLQFEGRLFEDNFLIADVRVKEERPAERWFWFDPPFNPGRSALLHKQPDDVWRLDFQLGWNIDRDACTRPENVAPLVRGMLGPDCEFQQEWYSVYTFQCRRMERFVHDRVIFAGDSAHLVSPFGARGCNGGVADADNLAWKLDLVIRGDAPTNLLDSYDYEQVATADENIRNSSRSTDFMTPRSDASHALRDAVLELARDHPFARPFVNSGRLSTAVAHPQSPLNTFDESGDTWAGIPPGSVALDAPTTRGWLLERLGLGDFALLCRGCELSGIHGVRIVDVPEEEDPESMVAARYDLREGSAYLIRPDQYVAARWRTPTALAICAALARAMGHGR